MVFSHPPIGTVGLTEPQAREQYGDDAVKVYKSSFTAMYTAVTSPSAVPHEAGVRRPGREDVGIHGIGFGMDEMLQGFAVALKMGATKKTSTTPSPFTDGGRRVRHHALRRDRRMIKSPGASFAQATPLCHGA